MAEYYTPPPSGEFDDQPKIWTPPQPLNNNANSNNNNIDPNSNYTASYYNPNMFNQPNNNNINTNSPSPDSYNSTSYNNSNNNNNNNPNSASFGPRSRVSNPSSGPTPNNSMNYSMNYNNNSNTQLNNNNSGSFPNISAPLPSQMSSFLSNPMAQYAMNQYGSQLANTVMNGGGLFHWLSLHKLRPYFAVNNRYVLSKLKILLLPCLHSQWRRQRFDTENEGLLVDGITGNYTI